MTTRTAVAEWSAEPYAPGDRQVWDELVRRSRQRHFLFERPYMDYHADRFDDASLILLHRGEAVAALPLNRDGDVVHSHAGLTFGGLLTPRELTTARVLGALEAAGDALRAQGVRRLVYKPVPHLYHLEPAEEDLYWLTRSRAHLLRRDLSAALHPADAPPYTGERARAVRRGREVGLTMGESDAFEEFMGLQREVLLARHGLEPVHTPEEMRLLADRFPGRIRLFEARDGAELVAGVVVYETPQVAHAQYIASSERGRDLRAQDALFDLLLREVYAAHPWFDFGISNEADGSLNEGLMRNKEGFGARAVAHDRWVVEIR
jgi:Acetyltransferase (GNAT) domain